MKKATLFFVTSFASFMLISCSSSFVMDVAKLHNDKPAVDYKKYKMDNSTAESMIKSYKGCIFFLRKNPQYISELSGVKDQLKAAFPGANVETIFARYKGAESAKFYCDNINSNADPESCKVDRYTTLIARVTMTTMNGKELVKTIAYYNFSQICPPPKNSCNK